MSNPKLRFKREDGTDYPEWRHTCVGEVFDKVKDKNKGCSNTNVVTNSAEFGLISQRDFFDKDIAVEGKTNNYTIIKANDFVYNPRKSSFAPFGAFNGYTLTDDGIVSPLYFCLRMKNNEMSANFMLWYFKSSRWHRFIYENGEQGGARYDRVGVSEEMLKGIPIDKPCFEEQQKIADFLSTVDKVIAQSEEEVQNLEQQKKAAMQKIFLQEVRFKREDGTDYPEWEEKKLGDVESNGKITLNRGNIIPKGEGQYPVYSSSVKNNGLMCYVDTYMFDRELVTWSIDGGGDFFYRPKHKFSVTNVSGYIDIVDENYLNYRYLAYHLQELHGHLYFDYQTKAHPSVIRDLYIIHIPDIEEQQKIADFLSTYDEAISYAKQELDKWKELKKGLLQQMFV